MSNFLTFKQFMCLEFYFVVACLVYWHMYVNKNADFIRAIIAAALWPIGALLSLLYAQDRH